LVRRHQGLVFSLVYHFLHDRNMAEEVAQEVFLALHRHMADIQSPEHAVFWLRKVSLQRAIDVARRRKRRPQVSLDDVPEPAAPASPRDPLLGETLRRLVATLPEAPRTVMILRYQEDLDPSEISTLLEMPIGTVKSHLQRSLSLLREKLERRGMGDS
jgi:RNA polymerase sigma-70 factor (ECF subfamily)